MKRVITSVAIWYVTDPITRERKRKLMLQSEEGVMVLVGPEPQMSFNEFWGNGKLASMVQTFINGETIWEGEYYDSGTRA